LETFDFYVEKKSSISPTCYHCKGSCWDPNSQTKTQAAVLERFGTMPNNCVNDSDGTVRCPAALGLL